MAVALLAYFVTGGLLCQGTTAKELGVESHSGIVITMMIKNVG